MSVFKMIFDLVFFVFLFFCVCFWGVKSAALPLSSKALWKVEKASFFFRE